ncbi:protein tyrosine phosphatase [Fructilactobacillus lindneri]|uniref:Protein tyrosine phosphatase n=1 Tax=Fructilactobacillus lindneri TaxID=53444 RepID=A0AB33BI02_9LACO|nr:protein tyrosine phosphatase [Fructilactobacillus lindneri]POH23281.1 protein tyrosine phosphatase [Fructilactobacillus lindneri DSM 20690 = JCM 11027]ANZ58713.1 protein tyrosine phosphatase [Fructilactobacillus lindneri]POG97931.1 protein tyrosine phosphatase [Fructilactobacillus lindneri]POG99263.1 protein tyrosine phosphatase [Fructilactobacillus lindneri]
MENKRVISLDSTDNFRELGGYKTADGHTIKWHKLLRSGSLGNLNQKDLNFLENYGVRYDVDLRSDPEVADAPDQIQVGAIDYIFDPIFNEDRTDNSQDPDDFRKILETNKTYGYDHMIDVYRQMVTHEYCRNAFHNLFMILLENKKDGQSVLFHCTAGKDRTGMSALLILSALGVDLETIKEDYILTNKVVKHIIDAKVEDVKHQDFSPHAIESLKTLYSVNMDFLNAAIAEINHRYNNMDNFLHEGIGLTDQNITDLKAIYLE